MRKVLVAAACFAGVFSNMSHAASSASITFGNLRAEVFDFNSYQTQTLTWSDADPAASLYSSGVDGRFDSNSAGGNSSLLGDTRAYSAAITGAAVSSGLSGRTLSVDGHAFAPDTFYQSFITRIGPSLTLSARSSVTFYADVTMTVSATNSSPTYSYSDNALARVDFGVFDPVYGGQVIAYSELAASTAHDAYGSTDSGAAGDVTRTLTQTMSFRFDNTSDYYSSNVTLFTGLSVQGNGNTPPAVSSVPEADAVLMTLSGLSVVAWLRRRRLG
jgi:hypothetical protein